MTNVEFEKLLRATPLCKENEQANLNRDVIACTFN